MRTGAREAGAGGRSVGRWVPVFLAGFLAGVAVMGVATRGPALPRQYEVTGTVTALNARGDAFAIRTADGEVLGFALGYETEGADLVEVGRRVRLTVLAGDGISEIVARVERVGAAGPG
ncbi:hypothetical protein HRbin12_00768 [bacterium HR12]|nr:hypothetical protein HRbin12_00768 [bacterium HR12]